MLYLDTSALAKLVIASDATPSLRAFLEGRADATLFSSALADAELVRTVMPAGDEAVSTARRVLAGLHLVDVTRELLERAGALRTSSRLGTLGAIHLVTAMAVEHRLDTVVTYDGRMLAAAAELGLDTRAP
jgi:uncharacterized protein